MFVHKQKKIITRDRNPLVKGLRRNQGSFIRNPVKKLGYQKLVDYGCKPFLKLHMYKSKLDSRSFYYQEIHSRSATLTDRNLNVYRIENLGTCCWEIYSGTHFSGAKEKLGKNHDKAPKNETSSHHSSGGLLKAVF